MPVDLDALQYRPLVDACPRGAFRCGESSLDKWLLKESCRRHEDHTCRVTTVHIGDAAEPVGFFAMGLILESDRYLSGGGPIRNRVISKVYPALHLEYLAVHRDYHHNDIGTHMMVRVLDTFRRAVEETGVPVLTLAPLKDSLIPFYEELGFRRYAVHVGERRMMLPAQTIMDLARRVTPSA